MNLIINFNIFCNCTKSGYAQNHQEMNSTQTFSNVYKTWLKQHISHFQVSKSTISSYKNAFKHCQSIHNKLITEIKYKDYQLIIDSMRNDGLSYSSVKKVKSLISLVEKHALKTDQVSKSYAHLINIGKNKKIYPHTIFTRRQINKLWRNTIPYTDTVLILLYTGMRVGEMLTLKNSDISLHKKCIKITKSKTLSSIRTIPIHSRIFPLIEARVKSSKIYLIEKDTSLICYTKYRHLWDNVMKSINTNHRPHDTRHTFATLLDAANANPNAKRRLLGHATGDVTDRVYTHKTLQQLRKTIQLLK